jgi:hypothetical protein
MQMEEKEINQNQDNLQYQKIQQVVKHCINDIQQYQLNLNDVDYLIHILRKTTKQRMTIAPASDKNDCQ